MLLASVSEQYGASIPSTRLAKNTVDRTMAKHGQLPMFLSSEFCAVSNREQFDQVRVSHYFSMVSLLLVSSSRLQRHIIWLIALILMLCHGMSITLNW
jgi:hypothetical protein